MTKTPTARLFSPSASERRGADDVHGVDGDGDSNGSGGGGGGDSGDDGSDGHLSAEALSAAVNESMASLTKEMEDWALMDVLERNVYSKEASEEAKKGKEHKAALRRLRKEMQKKSKSKANLANEPIDDDDAEGANADVNGDDPG